MEIGAATDIIARMKEQYASVHADNNVKPKDSYIQQVNLQDSYGKANHGFALQAVEVLPGPPVQFLPPNFDPLANGGGSPLDAARAYADGANFTSKPATLEYGSLRMLKSANATQWFISNPDTAEDADLIAAADGRARETQKATDQEAARKEIASVFRQAGMDETSIYQLNFDQRQDGSIAVSNHPLAPQVEDMVNADQGLSTLIAFSLGFNGGHKLDA